jgi:rubrerythrin
MTNESSGIGHLIDTCRRIEGTLASLYTYFEELHRETPEIAAMWRKTAMEEENHMRQFELASKLPSPITEANVDVLAADQLLEQLRELDARMRRLAPPPVEALRTAIEVERSLARYHMHTIGSFGDPGTQKMFKAMMAADRGHAEALLQTLERPAPPPTNQ